MVKVVMGCGVHDGGWLFYRKPEFAELIRDLVRVLLHVKTSNKEPDL